MPEDPPAIRHLRSDIPGFKDSFALISTAKAAEVDRAVVFVHGFNGSARATWADFISLIDTIDPRSWWDRSDIYFFHYRWASIFRQVSRNALSLLSFLETIFPQPPPEVFRSPDVSLRPQHKYKYLTLVGHSEGGLLSRKVILEVAGNDDRLETYRRSPTRVNDPEPQPEGIEVADLRLFAPAIAGEALTGILGIISGSSIVAPLLKVSAAKTSMASPSSPIVTTRQNTEYYSEFLSMPCFRAHILWADNDEVVLSEKYLRDKSCKNLRPLTDHSSVCKPSLLYLLPVHFVEKGVVDGKCN
jgi:pimeloyl-ACP methyl ester carboxylesterase